jgi:hypothetical protein
MLVFGAGDDIDDGGRSSFGEFFVVKLLLFGLDV